MKFKEFMGKTFTGAAGLGSSKFRWSLDKEMPITPHEMMRRVQDMLETRPHLYSGLKQYVSFLISDIGFASDDAKSIEFMNEWLDKRPEFKTHLFNFTTLLIGCGTSYMEPSYIKRTNGTLLLDNVAAVPAPEIMYRNLKTEEEDDYWLMEVPIEVRNYDGKSPQYRPIWYVKGSSFFYKYIWCIPYPKSKYVHATFGLARTLPYYGWGLLSVAIDNEDIEREILKNWALMAKYRAMGKKIIGFYNSSDDSVSLQELENIKQDLANLEEEDSLLVNKRFDQTDLTFTGQDNDMQSQIDWLSKDSGSALVPNYMTAFSQDSSMATAAEAKIPFSLELTSVQPIIVSYLNGLIIKELKKVHTWLADDLTFTLGLPQLYSRSEMFDVVERLYNNRAATFNELRVSAGLEPVEGGNIWGEVAPLDRITVKKDETPMTEALKNKLDKQIKESFKTIIPSPKKAEIIDVKIPIHNKGNNKIQTEKLKKEAIKNAVKEMLQ